MPAKYRSLLFLSFLIFSLILTPFSTATQVAAKPATVANTAPTEANPNYYFDRETTFILKFGLDNTFGGFYTAVDSDGKTLDDYLPTQVWGFAGNSIRGTDKSHLAQAICIRYLVTEYQRVTVGGYGVDEINKLLTAAPSVTQPLNSVLDLLGRARSCADFAINHLEIPASAQANLGSPNMLYYWSFSNREGTGGFMDDTASNAQYSAARSESSLSWSIAELALALKRAGQPEGVWGIYRDAALRWWNWRQDKAAPLPAYGNASQPFKSGSCDTPGGINPNNCQAGVGRDLFYPALGFTLSEITGNASYRDIATRFANDILGTGNVPIFSPNATNVPVNTLQDQTYAAGFGRAIIFAKQAQQNLGTLTDRDQWWDFGNNPARLDPPDLSPWRNPEMSDANLSVPFAHFRGRELVAGTGRSLWFYYSFGENPAIYYKGTFNQEAVTRKATLDYWHFLNEKLWDNTTGQAAWFEALNQPYKPCFSGGTDVPIADWLPPVFGNVSQILAPDNVATIKIASVNDPEWPYLNWNFKGSGVASVELVYSIDRGKSWQTHAIAPQTADLSATIPAQPIGTVVNYYVRSRDYFGNASAFPAGAESWRSDGTSLGTVLSKTQTYTITTAPQTANYWWLILVGLLLIALIAGGFWWFFGRKRRMFQRYKAK